MAIMPEESLSPNHGNVSEEDKGHSGNERKEQIIWGFHQIAQFRKTFRTIGLLTAFMAHTLSKTCRTN